MTMMKCTMSQEEKDIRMSIALKMQEDGMDPEKIFRYTGVRPPERKKEHEAYDLAAKQVAAEMLMRGYPVDSICLATQLPYGVVRELQQQYASFFGGEPEEIPEPPAR